MLGRILCFLDLHRWWHTDGHAVSFEDRPEMIVFCTATCKRCGKKRSKVVTI